MIQHLINTTVIWLVSLVLFDVAFRHDTRHRFNRMYLVAGLLTGLLLPLLRLKGAAIATIPIARFPVQRATEVHDSISAATTTASPALSLQAILMGLYLTGVLISIGLLLREAAVLVRWFREGKKTTFENTVVVYTGKPHGPFSVLRYLFISTETAYTRQELDFILRHELEHIRRGHTWDKLLALAIRTLFWFHPLPYVYYKRLMMVHEFEADAMVDRPADYGQFLITQNMRGPMATIAHSLNYSPLKNRIIMLTKNASPAGSGAKYLLTIPVFSILALCCTKAGAPNQREQKGNTITFKGNTFGMTPQRSESMIMENDSGEQATMVIEITPSPATMNGEKIYSYDSVDRQAQLKEGGKSMEELLIKSAEDELARLPDGRYMIPVFYLMTDKTGKVVYYNLDGVVSTENRTEIKVGDPIDKERIVRPRKVTPVAKDLQHDILLAMEQGLNKLRFSPAMHGGSPVIAYVKEPFRMNDQIIVKDHSVSLLSSN